MVPVQQLISYTLKDVCFNSLFPGQPGLTDLHILITRFCRLCAVSDASPTNSFFSIPFVAEILYYLSYLFGKQWRVDFKLRSITVLVSRIGF